MPILLELTNLREQCINFTIKHCAVLQRDHCMEELTDNTLMPTAAMDRLCTSKKCVSALQLSVTDA